MAKILLALLTMGFNGHVQDCRRLCAAPGSKVGQQARVHHAACDQVCHTLRRLAHLPHHHVSCCLLALCYCLDACQSQGFGEVWWGQRAGFTWLTTGTVVLSLPRHVRGMMAVEQLAGGSLQAWYDETHFRRFCVQTSVGSSRSKLCHNIVGTLGTYIRGY